jgi:hypothetical protein
MKNEGLWLVAGVVVLWWWMKNNGRGFNPTRASGELTGNPNPIISPQGGLGLLFGERGNVYSGNPVQTISGTWHL